MYRLYCSSFLCSSSSPLLFVVLTALQGAVFSISRYDFPTNFVFGAGTSAYQVEGAAAEDGRTASVWDTFAHAGLLKDKSNGDRACDQYHKYKEDVQLMVDTGLDAYRFSISWSRLIPNGRGPINPKGLQYYNNLINELIKHGIQPHVTLFHYDLPQVLEDEYGGWLDRKIVRDFTAYADVCFREFGDRVSHWTTLNEPNSLSLGGYDLGILPPNRCSSPFGANCTRGDSTVEPYIATHNCLLAHASAATLYKREYQAEQHGVIGLNIFTYWVSPLTDSAEDASATRRAFDLFIGWFLNPLAFGDYPETMKKSAGSKIPSFTLKQAKQVKGSFDFLGLNHYITVKIKDDSSKHKTDQGDVYTDMGVKRIDGWNRKPNGELPYDPSGLQKVLEQIKQVYGNIPVYIHENGQRTPHNSSSNDKSRVAYVEGFLESLLDAVSNGCDVRGYFVWSFMDLFELKEGYESSYGLYYIDFKSTDLTRHLKLSANWYSSFLKGGSMNINETIQFKNSVSLSTSHYTK
ncbi:hypothetical protein Scep_009024 [Stephania cephalantha]|uniref:Beta-glucosidase n=1 Tax=Stephania cephalantha TaxID=152367 RepID=A0AAP0PC59_9MAGN